ncbi:hypothetical protein [Flammeovirga sp. EKP202]|uniref:hypothetical protein n=1 Tax=Flammeovirga sp. EKP202 TaxID=2770592 RepID=UPI00165F5436|nr:hypothetical protein [Flammeovirga sp. EKP202]MBD0403043.1 hypothetical protein [Flammeovirga sp. EKP202]
MGKSIIFLFVLLLSNTFGFCQVEKDSLLESYIYPPNSYNNYDGLTPKESWDIHKAAYIKQLKAKGGTSEEYDKSLLDYEKQKKEFLTLVEERNRIAEVQREKDAELRKKHAIQRHLAEERRKKSQAWRENAKEILIKNITLTHQTDDSESMAFKVTSKMTLYIGIRAHIKSGSTLIEIYNPKGVKEGELSLKYQSDANQKVKEYTSGALDKTISNTEVGEWQIKISSQKSNGNIAMSVAQSIKPTVDE